VGDMGEATPDMLLGMREWVAAVRAYRGLVDGGRPVDVDELQRLRSEVAEAKAAYESIRQQNDLLYDALREAWRAIARDS